MFLDHLLNQGSAPVLEQMLQFTDARAQVLGSDIVNASTPNFVQQDLSLDKFQSMLAEKVEQRDAGGAESADFSDISSEVQHPTRGILFHDGNNRSMEQLMTDQAKNTLMHNLAVELLRDQYSTMEMALKERVG